MPYPIQDFVINQHIPNATDATDQTIFIAPYDCKLVSVQTRHRVASSGGTMDVKKAASGTAIAAGTSLLTAVMSNASAAATNVTGSLKAGIGDLDIPKGFALGLNFGGTLTNLADLDVTMVIRQLRRF